MTTNKMPDELMIARSGLSYVCPAWSKDEHATKYIRADLANQVRGEEVSEDELIQTAYHDCTLGILGVKEIVKALRSKFVISRRET